MNLLTTLTAGTDSLASHGESAALGINAATANANTGNANPLNSANSADLAEASSSLSFDQTLAQHIVEQQNLSAKGPVQGLSNNTDSLQGTKADVSLSLSDSRAIESPISDLSSRDLGAIETERLQQKELGVSSQGLNFFNTRSYTQATSYDVTSLAEASFRAAGEPIVEQSFVQAPLAQAAPEQTPIEQAISEHGPVDQLLGAERADSNVFATSILSAQHNGLTTTQQSIHLSSAAPSSTSAGLNPSDVGTQPLSAALETLDSSDSNAETPDPETLNTETTHRALYTREQNLQGAAVRSSSGAPADFSNTLIDASIDNPLEGLAAIDADDQINAHNQSAALPKVQSTIVDAQNHRFSVNVQFGRAEWATEVASQVSRLAAQNLNFAEIQLDPPELGSLQVRVQVNNEQAVVSFTAQSSAVKDSLEQHGAKLREMFEAEGMNLVDVEVRDQHQQRGSQDEQSSSANTASQNDGLAPDSKGDSQVSEAATIVTQSELAMGVDDYV